MRSAARALAANKTPKIVLEFERALARRQVSVEGERVRVMRPVEG